MWQTMSNHSRSWQCPPPPRRQAFTPFAVSCNFFKSLLVSVCNSLCSVTFKVLRASCVIPTDSIFKKPHQKEVVMCREVWWSWWPSPRLIMRTPKNFCKKAAVVFTIWARLGKPETPLIILRCVIPVVLSQILQCIICMYLHIHRNTTINRWYHYVIYITVQYTTCFGPTNGPSSGCW